MALSGKRPCTGGCGRLVHKGNCPECSRKIRKRQDATRRGALERTLYASTQWKAARVQWLRENPMCVCSQCQGRRLPATVVDHDPPHHGDPDAFWDQSTWRSMAKPCHDRKTATYDGGFGNARRQRVENA